VIVNTNSCHDHITPNFDVPAAMEFLWKNPANMTMKYGSICIRSNQWDRVKIFRTHRDIKGSLMTILIFDMPAAEFPSENLA
jgi:hypothetical protein